MESKKNNNKEKKKKDRKEENFIYLQNIRSESGEKLIFQ